MVMTGQAKGDQSAATIEVMLGNLIGGFVTFPERSAHATDTVLRFSQQGHSCLQLYSKCSSLPRVGILLNPKLPAQEELQKYIVK